MAHLTTTTAAAALLLASAGCRLGSRQATLMPMEVTVSEYAACVAAGACAEPRTAWKTCNWSDRANRGDHPINCVDWNQARAYCEWAGSRLPEESEWLDAARGASSSAADICAHRDDSGTCAAGSHPADSNAAGVLDLLANVKEWTGAKAMLPGGAEARVIRGGGWRIDPMAIAPETGLGNRETLPPAEFAADLGFRCMFVH